MAEINPDVMRRAKAVAPILQRFGRVRCVILFGSHVDGHPDEYSDIDIAAFMDGVETWDVDQRVKARTAVQKELGLEMEVHFYPTFVLASPPPASFPEFVIEHGVRVWEEEGNGGG